MRVTVRLFARLRDVAGTGELVKELTPGATVQQLWRDLEAEFPEFTKYERVVSSAVNADYAHMQDVLREGDEVAFLPPVSGGAV